jgi:hypothetical protein
MYSVYTYLIEELRHGNDVKGWFLTFVTSHLMRSMNAEAVLKHRVRNEQTSGQKKLPSKGVLIFYFFPAHMQIFRPIGHTFGSRRERVKRLGIDIFFNFLTLKTF